MAATTCGDGAAHATPLPAVFDQLLAVPSPYCSLSPQGEFAAAEEGGGYLALGGGCQRPPTVFEAFDVASFNAITSQLQPWLERHCPGQGIVWVEAEEPQVLRHAFQLQQLAGPPESPGSAAQPGNLWAAPLPRLPLGWAEFRELAALAAEAAALRGRQVMFFRAATEVLDSEGRRVPPALLRGIYPKLAFLPGSRFGDHVLTEVPPDGSSPTDRSWGGYAHTTLRTFRDETVAAYCSAMRQLYEVATVCVGAETAAAFGLLPAVTPEESGGVRVGEALRPAVRVPAGRLYSSAEDETRRVGLIPAAELEVILASGKLALPIRNLPYVVWRLAAALPGLTWIQDGFVVVPCPSLAQYVGLKNLAHEASSEPEEGFTIYFLFATQDAANFGDLAAKHRFPAARTAFCRVDDHRLSFAVFVHLHATPPDSEVGRLVAEMPTLRAKVAASLEARPETPAELKAKLPLATGVSPPL